MILLDNTKASIRNDVSPAYLIRANPYWYFAW